MTPIQPAQGSKWLHKATGTIYEFICIARMEWNPAINTVVYKDDTYTWVRPADEFFDGRFEEIQVAGGEIE